jgi:hypothetical protein
VNKITIEKVMDMNTPNFPHLLERDLKNSLSRMISNPRKSSKRLASTMTTLEKRGVKGELPLNTNPPLQLLPISRVVTEFILANNSDNSTGLEKKTDASPGIKNILKPR